MLSRHERRLLGECVQTGDVTGVDLVALVRAVLKLDERMQAVVRELELASDRLGSLANRVLALEERARAGKDGAA